MTNKPAESAVERYGEHRANQLLADSFSVDGNVADAAIAELQARIEELTVEVRNSKFNSYNELRKRADDAEQKLAETKDELDLLKRKAKLLARGANDARP